MSSIYITHPVHAATNPNPSQVGCYMVLRVGSVVEVHVTTN